jgi:hypothetical protein
MCAGALVHCDRTVREQVARPWSWMRRVCTAALVHYYQTVSERVARPGMRMRRVRASTLGTSGQAKNEDAVSACEYTGGQEAWLWRDHRSRGDTAPLQQHFGSYFLSGGRATAAACKRRSYKTQNRFSISKVSLYRVVFCVEPRLICVCQEPELETGNALVPRHIFKLTFIEPQGASHGEH